MNVHAGGITLAVGTATRRPDSRIKLLGRETFVGDLSLKGALAARLVLSPYPHARIRSVDREAALQMQGVRFVLTAKELGPCDLLAEEEALYVGHPVAVVLADSEAEAEDGADQVRVDYEPLPANTDAAAAMQPDAPLTRPEGGHGDADAGAHGAAVTGVSGVAKPHNAGEMAVFRRGDVARAFQEADVVIEDTYRLPRVHQGYLEPQGIQAEPTPDGRMALYVSSQGAFTSRNFAARVLGQAPTHFRVTALAVGGGFGGKFALLEPLGARLAEVAQRPVKLLLDRSQDFLVVPNAPACEIFLRMGATRDGRITAIESEIRWDGGIDGGAPVGIAAFIGSTYPTDNLFIKSYEILTHTTPVGAYRAPGAPQAAFALESHVDRLARALGLDPMDFRLANVAREGMRMANDQPWPAVGSTECLEALKNHPLWQNRKGLPDGEGIGVSLAVWLGGLEPAAGGCRVEPDGTLTIQVGSVDLTGTNTSMALIAAEVFGLSPDQVRVVNPDTDSAPYAGAAGGSKTLYTVGKAVMEAAQQAREQVLEMAGKRLEAAPEDLELQDGRVFVRGVPSKSLSLGELSAMATRFGSPYPPLEGRSRNAIRTSAPGFAAHLAHVRVDRETGVTEVLHYVAVQDVGKAINPPAVDGQIRGGTAQGLGRTLLEAFPYDRSGQPLALTLADYALPGAGDLPNIEVVCVEVPSEEGPFGARGVGEPPAVPGPAAVASAIEDAIGVRLTELPVRPHTVVKALQESAASAQSARPAGTVHA